MLRVRCFREENSDPPVCGFHKVEFFQTAFWIDPNAPQLGYMTVNVCPVSGRVVA
jgi:hypothetical protein